MLIVYRFQTKHQATPDRRKPTQSKCPRLRPLPNDLRCFLLSCLTNSSFYRKELELKIREAKKRKKEKFALKIKAMEELSEKEKNKWKSFNSKLQTKTWKGVVKKNKYDLPENHENKIGVGTNSATNRIITPNGTVLPTNTSASASAAMSSASAKARHVSKSFKTSTFK